MKTGDYVRTKSGLIGKSMGSNAYDENKIAILIDNTKDIKLTPVIDKEQIINSSPNIIDLIEVGDYVNGHKVDEVDLDDIDDYGNDFRYIKTEHDFTLNHWVKENEIETIITKECFERMEYKVGE